MILEVNQLELTVYGAEAQCASCVQAPPAKATAEWLEAALKRKFDEKITVRYVDIYEPETDADRLYSKKILTDEYFYPLVVAGNEVLGEGFISLKPVVQYCSHLGLTDSVNDRSNEK
ncbi:DUF1462 family protein [Sporolactobacillus kofuensis]|uniref:DUF1462 family protein n=1 Tax=Sporolactobacillus kofuensis TaxID=269672 RepID=A0ABW1WGQ9_9BACL|nr:DUF1462 family protein [Sporolactobacillus kofuensis]MCO7176035.1 YuzD family protein [Sporolactobacillus kofuensis]